MNYLESISFDTVSSQEESGEHYDLKFVPGYNGIVGSRGSGKSLLAHVLVGENLNPYKDIIDISSIRYKRFGGVESSNPLLIYILVKELSRRYLRMRTIPTSLFLNR